MYVGPKGLLFVEYKYVKTLPKRDSTLIKHSLSELQLQWLQRVNGPAKSALIIGVEDSAIILDCDYSTNISKLHYIEQSVSRRDVAAYIYNVTHLG
jgi:hypothetical protein